MVKPFASQVLIAVPCASVPGLCIQARQTGHWVLIDRRPEESSTDTANGGQRDRRASAIRRETLEPMRHVVIFAGAALEEATGGRLRAAPHCVVKCPGARRHSMVYELRATAIPRRPPGACCQVPAIETAHATRVAASPGKSATEELSQGSSPAVAGCSLEPKSSATVSPLAVKPPRSKRPRLERD
jgi:hypothetical protein